jgi:hypothetical protein
MRGAASSTHQYCLAGLIALPLLRLEHAPEVRNLLLVQCFLGIFV